MCPGTLQEKPTFLFQGKARWPLSPLGLAAPKALTSALSHVGGTLICHETLLVFPKNRKRAFTVALLAVLGNCPSPACHLQGAEDVSHIICCLINYGIFKAPKMVLSIWTFLYVQLSLRSKTLQIKF